MVYVKPGVEIIDISTGKVVSSKELRKMPERKFDDVYIEHSLAVIDGIVYHKKSYHDFWNRGKSATRREVFPICKLTDIWAD